MAHTMIKSMRYVATHQKTQQGLKQQGHDRHIHRHAVATHQKTQQGLKLLYHRDFVFIGSGRNASENPAGIETSVSYSAIANIA